ncbi:MAG: hypothetical protein UT14_C0033G0019 [Candidatus Shapirobacteria bacterium GW2011_GWE1_38_92]|uniref:Uncharacterized protein n=1 Tax=Candidatus Shapirobacteria bacterium GW2011_GWE1_38_92 TaxID=1618489 RepID=A0A0G0NXR6_9BACT|nr:MAG: hypothetical protein UT14_C0033G0019 [Candidatus Shapirobacteria bacterium GW2011_GWE1_38_92]
MYVAYPLLLTSNLPAGLVVPMPTLPVLNSKVASGAGAVLPVELNPEMYNRPPS